jgi:UDP-glucose 4-epimerase
VDSVLITGVAGFIGSHVARRFIDEGHHVFGVDDLSGGEIANVPPGVQFLQLDLASASAVAALPACRWILHLAGQSSGEVSFDDPTADLHKNTVSTLNLIRYGIERRAQRLVYASSMSVYGAVEDRPVEEHTPCAPLSCYGVGKLAAEGYLRVYAQQLPSVCLRMFNVYGPGQNMKNLRQGMVSIYLAQALASGRIEVKGSLERFRDFIFIDDVVEAWWRATTYEGVAGRALNVGTGVRTSVRQLLTRLCEYLNLETVTPLDEGLAAFVAWACRCGA